MLNQLKEGLLDILLPKKCLGCGREGQYICKNCEVFLSEIAPILGNPIVSVWEYEGIIEKAFRKIKFDGQYDIINELVEKALEKIVLELPNDTYITYVPMHKKRERQRGFNQTELIARKIGKITSRPAAGLLERTKDNRTQVGLGPAERIANVRDAFRLSRPGLDRLSRPGLIVLVDDVYTTGATMNECIKTLKKGRIKNIWGFTLSRKMSIQNY